MTTARQTTSPLTPDNAGLRAVSDAALLQAFTDWDGYSEVDVAGTRDGEDLYWELHRRGIAPAI